MSHEHTLSVPIVGEYSFPFLGDIRAVVATLNLWYSQEVDIERYKGHSKVET
jgi:hypothetical protein